MIYGCDVCFVESAAGTYGTDEYTAELFTCRGYTTKKTLRLDTPLPFVYPSYFCNTSTQGVGVRLNAIPISNLKN